MIHYIQGANKENVCFACTSPNGTALGVIYQGVDGFFYFQAYSIGFWSSAMMKDVAMKLEGLNATWQNKLQEDGAGGNYTG